MPLSAYILTGALSDMRPVKLVMMDGPQSRRSVPLSTAHKLADALSQIAAVVPRRSGIAQLSLKVYLGYHDELGGVHREANLSGQEVYESEKPPKHTVSLSDKVAELVERQPKETTECVAFWGGGSTPTASKMSLYMGRGTVVVKLLSSYLGELGSSPGGVSPWFSHLGIVLDDYTRRQVFSRISRFTPPLHPGIANYTPHFILICSQDLDLSRNDLGLAHFINAARGNSEECVVSSRWRAGKLRIGIGSDGDRTIVQLLIHGLREVLIRQHQITVYWGFVN
ncbi:hypothetical protein PR048_024060 [Dryococelus australis]|uniref:Uncharacterized protein n=1 Tax=Dryococelus australis TaxID=614101 RepID=A0ABQ9GVT6_9NEOP|nr:hypothetical protein PR048_024060 [Dryococelus australis]